VAIDCQPLGVGNDCRRSHCVVAGRASVHAPPVRAHSVDHRRVSAFIDEFGDSVWESDCSFDDEGRSAASSERPGRGPSVHSRSRAEIVGGRWCLASSDADDCYDATAAPKNSANCRLTFGPRCESRPRRPGSGTLGEPRDVSPLCPLARRFGGRGLGRGCFGCSDFASSDKTKTQSTLTPGPSRSEALGEGGVATHPRADAMRLAFLLTSRTS